MTARWDKLPAKAKAVKPRREVERGVWRCEGVRGCGTVLDGTYAAAQRHVDIEHGAARLSIVLDPERGKVGHTSRKGNT